MSFTNFHAHVIHVIIVRNNNTTEIKVFGFQGKPIRSYGEDFEFDEVLPDD